MASSQSSTGGTFALIRVTGSELVIDGGLTARRVLGDSLRLKWPNDLVTPEGDKVAGLLAERTGDVVIIGLGANLYWETPPPGMAAVVPSDPGPERAREAQSGNVLLGHAQRRREDQKNQGRSQGFHARQYSPVV